MTDPFDELAAERYGSAPAVEVEDPFDTEAKRRYFPELSQMTETAGDAARLANTALSQRKDVKLKLRERGLKEELKGVGYATKELRTATKAPNLLLSAAKKSGDEDLIEQATEAKANAKNPIDQRTLFEKTIDVIDTPGRAGRALAMSAMGGPSATFQGILDRTQGDEQEFHRMVREKVPLIHELLSVSATPFSIPAGIVASGSGVLSDLVQGKLPDAGNARRAMSEAYKDGGDFVASMVVDPLTYVGGAEKSSAQKFTQSAKKLKGTTPEIVKAFAKEAPNIAGKANQAELLLELGARHKISPDELKKAFKGVVDLDERVFKPGVKQQVSSLRHQMNNSVNEEIAKAANSTQLDTKAAGALRSEVMGAATKRAKSQFDDFVTKSFPGADTATKAELDEMFEAGMKVMDSGPFAPLLNYWKEVNLFGRPGYHAVNMISDSILMTGQGLKNPLRAKNAVDIVRESVPAARKILVDAAGKTWTKSELREVLTKNGLISPVKSKNVGMVDMDAVRSAGSIANESKRAALRAEGKNVRAALHGINAADVTTLGMNRVGKSAAKRWDELSKTTFFLDRLAKGDSVEAAVRATYQVLPDYTEPAKGLAMARKAFPLIGWAYRMAPNIAKTSIKNPKTLTAPIHFSRAFGEEDPDRRDISPEYVRERNLTIPLDEQGRNTVGNFSQRFTGERPPPGYGISMTMREPRTELLGQVTNLSGLANQITPLYQPLHEAIAQKYMMTGAERSNEGFNLFHQGATGAGSIESPEGSGAVSDYTGMVLGSLPMWFANEWNRRNGREALFGPPSMGKDYKEGPKSGLKAINTLTGAGLHMTTPATLFQEASFDPLIKKGAGMKSSLKKLKKERRDGGKWKKQGAK